MDYYLPYFKATGFERDPEPFASEKEKRVYDAKCSNRCGEINSPVSSGIATKAHDAISKHKVEKQERREEENSQAPATILATSLSVE